MSRSHLIPSPLMGEGAARRTILASMASLLAASPVLATPPPIQAQPFPIFHTRDLILFQGDSITDGGRQREGMDYNHIMGQDYDYIIAAEIGARFPERDLNFVNRGISGNTVVDLAARWQTDTLDLKPNLLSILVGVNDTLFSNGETVETYAETYDRLIAQTQAKLPGVKIVLGQPFVLPVGPRKDGYAAILAEVKRRQLVVAALAAKYACPLVLYQAALDAACRRGPPDHWSWDGVHPTYAGHWIMAQTWLQTLDAFWPNG